MSRVLVTREAEDAEGLVGLLAQAGHVPVLAPMIAREAVPLPDALLRHGWGAALTPDVLLLTSASAVAGLPDPLPEGFAPGRVCCVGPATATAAQARGLRVDLVPERGTGADAVAALGDLRGRTVLWPRAAQSVAATTRALLAAGAHVIDLVVYRTVPHPHAALLLQRAGPVDVVTLTAPSIARAYAAARAQAPGHGAPPVVSLGPTTTAACEALDLQVRAEAGLPTLEALVAALGG